MIAGRPSLADSTVPVKMDSKMATFPNYTDIPGTGDIDRASTKTTRRSHQGEQAHFMLNMNSKEENEVGNYTMITLDEAARLLNIRAATVRLWSDMGLLKTSISPGKGRMVRRADILTFLPKENKAVSFMDRTNDDAVEAGLKRQERKKLAEINVRAITELTRQSVSKISHLGSRPTARIGK